MKPNRLATETSPYLVQHSNNPVNWFPWGTEALELARKENKLIFISIGYSACHWCHVMERESYYNESIAKYLNNNYISIKIDREERPDLDQTYMSAVQLMSGGGGWPLNCFTTPEGRPFYGGTYFNPEQFYTVITELHKIWENNPAKIMNHADGLCEGIKNSSLIQERIIDYGLPQIDSIYTSLKLEFDTENGGFNRVPKFPLPSVYQFLLRYYYHTGDESALVHTKNTVDHIIRGGIYDQIGGGISRYSTDRYWHVPHFEKMLYDNAQFISLLSDLFSITKSWDYRDTLYQTIEFLDRELSNGKGGYYSALDADSEGEEGLYYVWKEKEIREITGKDFQFASELYGITLTGNWEAGKNILKRSHSDADLLSKSGLMHEEFISKIESIRTSLFEHRKSRVSPSLDTKVLTSWNALVIKAFAEAYHATGDEKLKQKALYTGNYLLNNMLDDKFILYRSDDRKIQGFLDDYAYVAKAFIFLYQISFDEIWLNHVKKLIDSIFKEFYDENTGMFFYSPENADNPVTRQLELTDNVIPSSNSALGKVLFYASVYFDNQEYLSIARQMLINIQPHLVRSPSFFSNWLSLLLIFQSDFSEVVLTGEQFHVLRKKFCGQFHPHLLFAGAEKSSELSLFHGRLGSKTSQIYVCRNRTCKMPVNSVDVALSLIKGQ